jgi:hypothetical protein
MSTPLAAILDLTEQVQAAIDSGDWPRAQELEGERRAALEKLVEASSVTEEIRAALADLYARNQRMIGEVQHHRRRIVRDAATIKTGRAAAAAYASLIDSSC